MNIFPDLSRDPSWKLKLKRWCRAQQEFTALQRKLQDVISDDSREQTEQKLALLRVRMCELSPPDRFLWLEGKPILDRWSVAADEMHE